MRISDWSSDVCSSDLTVELRPPRYRPPAIVAFERAAQRQLVEFRLFGQQEGQSALALALAVDGQEQVGEGGAVQRAAGSPHQPRHRIGDIGDRKSTRLNSSH